MINWIVKKYQSRKAEKEHIKFLEAIHNPVLFTEQQRLFLYSLFPSVWVHESNFTQAAIFKIAFVMECFGYKCRSVEDLHFCMDLLEAQQIFEVHPNDEMLIKRASR